MHLAANDILFLHSSTVVPLFCCDHEVVRPCCIWFAYLQPWLTFSDINLPFSFDKSYVTETPIGTEKDLSLAEDGLCDVLINSTLQNPHPPPSQGI